MKHKRVLLSLGLLVGISAITFVALAGIGIYRFGAAKHRLASVHPPVIYTGDGKFHDGGEDAGIYRFAIEVGPIATPNGTEMSFRLSGLPRANFLPFLVVNSPDATSRYSGAHAPWESSVLEVTIKHGVQTVAQARGPLSDWTLTSGAMFYQLHSDFDASPSSSYHVTATLTSAVPEFPSHRLVFLGGGWQDYATSRLHFPDEYPDRG